MEHTQRSRLLIPIILSIVASFIGGAFGSYVTLQIVVYRVSLLEEHSKEDKERFSGIEGRLNRDENDLAIIRERHRLEEIRRQTGSGP